MTTIAFDGVTLAADSQSTRQLPSKDKCMSCDVELTGTKRDVTKVNYYPRLTITFQGEPVIAWAGAGNAPLIEMFSEGLRQGVEIKAIGKMAAKVNAERMTQPTMTMLVVTAFTCYEVQYHFRMGAQVKEITKFPYSIGSGSKAALLAMKRLGFTAPAAVACGIDVDPHSGGEVCYVNCRGKAKERELLRYTYSPADIDELFE
jgi:hypothetical protein